MLLQYTILSVILLLSSCGGKNIDNVNPAGPEVINGIIVPPEPNKKENNATLVGIDTNKNGVRDDVERIMAKNNTNIKNFPDEIEYAKGINRYFLHTLPTTRDEALEIISESECIKGVRPNYDIEGLIFNTKDRKYFLTTVNNNTHAYFGGELKCGNK